MDPQSNVSSAFGGMAEIYEKSSGGSHRAIARNLMLLSPPFTSESRVLDNATGTGFVVEELQRHLSMTMPNSEIKIPVIAADAAAPMIQYLDTKIARMRIADTLSNLDPVKTHTVRAEDLSAAVVPDNTITHCYMSFGIFFCTDPFLAASNIYRCLAPGGTAFLTTFHDLDFFTPLFETNQAQYPTDPPVKLPFGDEWQDRKFVENLLLSVGFAKANMCILKEDTFMRFADVEAMASANTALFTGLCKRSKGWESQEAKEKFTAKLVEVLSQSTSFKDEGENGVTTKMVVNIWVCVK